MTSEVASIPKLVALNYIALKIKMIDVIRSKNLWRLVNGGQKKPAYAQATITWEEKCDQARGIIGQMIQIVFR